jgi:acetolactate synthase-1/2/3 large subunit
MPHDDSQTPTVAQILAAALARHGIDTVFGQSLPSALLLATPAHGIRQVEYRTENAGGAMADGYARATRRIGVVCAQNGPAATLLVPPLAEASRVSVPVLALVQDVPIANRGRNAFQEFDHFALFSSCTKAVLRVDEPERAEELLDLALTTALTGRPGPVVLLLPVDVLNLPGRRSGRSASHGRFPLDPVRPAADRVRAAAALLAGAQRPLILAGGGVHLSGATAALARLQEEAGLPVGTTNMGKGAVDEGHELSIGMVGNYMGERGVARHLKAMVSDADVLLLVGTRTNENGTDSWKVVGPDTQVIHLDADGIEVGRNYEALRLVGDARLGLEDLAEELVGRDLAVRRAARAGVVAAIAEAREAHVEQARDVTESDGRPLRPERIMVELDRVLTEDTIVVGDASYATIWIGNYLRARRAGQRFLTPRGLAGLGWGLPLALGAKAAAPNAPVVCVAGDGGFGHVWAELETAVRENLPLTIIILNNEVLAFQKHAEIFKYRAHTTAVNFAPVDHAAIARACGADGVRVETAEELAAALADTATRTTVTLIDVVSDGDAYPPITAWDGAAIVPELAAW